MNLLSFLPLLAAGGCTLLVDAQLSDKPAEAGGDGGGGGLMASGTSSSSAESSSAESSSASGGVPCPPNMANCDGIAAHGCNVNLQNDPDNCGSCNTKCMAIMQHCAGGKCQ
jgi:hypothetical protein